MKAKTRVLAALALSLFTLPALADGWKHESSKRGWHGNGHAYGHYQQRERREWREHQRHDRQVFREGYRVGYREGYRDGVRDDRVRYYAPRVEHRHRYEAPRRHYRGGDSLFGKLVIVLD